MWQLHLKGIRGGKLVFATLGICVSRSVVLLFATPWTVALQVPLSMGSSRQEYWSARIPGSPALQVNPPLSLVDSEPPGTVKNLPVMQETHVRYLGQKDPLEKGMATHSSILAWRIPWTEKLGGLQSTGSERIGHD